MHREPHLGRRDRHDHTRNDHTRNDHTRNDHTSVDHAVAGDRAGEEADDSTTRRTRDRGLSIVEVLVTIALMATTVTSVLVAVQTTTVASAIDRDHAIAFSWLQAASDEIYREARVPCDTATDPVAVYTTYAQNAARPPRWDATSATIEVVDVEYLGRFTPDADFEWDASFCFEGGSYVDSPLYTQRVTIQATGPEGEIVKTLQMVKNED